MQPRITLSRSNDDELEICLNEAGRDLLVDELRRLSRDSDHFHLGPENLSEVPLRTRAYRPDDRIIEWGKVMLRPDDWDAQHFPHVLDPSPGEDRSMD